jgi:hypothetical protein
MSKGLFVIDGKGIVREVIKSPDGKNIVELPDDWVRVEHVRLYKLKRIGE